MNIKFLLKNKDKNEIKKTILLSICFFLIISVYTITRELRDSVFFLIVGKKYLPDVKTISYFIMIPLAFFYGWLSNKVKKHFILIFYCILYGIIGFILSFYITQEQIGLFNLNASYNRIFGWIFYLVLEGHSSFLVSVMWSFFNSISHPKDMDNSYILMTAASKVGGILTSTLAWIALSKSFNIAKKFSGPDLYKFLMIIASIMLLLVPLIIFYITKTVPEKYLSGYSEEIEEKKENKEEYSLGIKTLFKQPYVLGMFGMIFFWEVINVVFNFMRLDVGYKSTLDITEFLAFLYKNMILSHLVGLIFVVFGTKFFIKNFGEKISLISIPLLTGLSVFLCLAFPSANSILISYTIMRAINFSFAFPLREALYIPTTKEIQFQSKSWIDSFGSKFSKAFGAFYNKAFCLISPSYVFIFQNTFFASIILIWTLVAYLLGKRWEKAIKNKEVIGL